MSIEEFAEDIKYDLRNNRNLKIVVERVLSARHDDGTELSTAEKEIIYKKTSFKL